MCGRDGEWDPKVEDIVARIWETKRVPIQPFGVRHKVFMPRF